MSVLPRDFELLIVSIVRGEERVDSKEKLFMLLLMLLLTLLLRLLLKYELLVDSTLLSSTESQGVIGEKTVRRNSWGEDRVGGMGQVMREMECW